ncbi:uncharacterized protein LOC111708864 [Eurytemora carolleeae]|uniref:uncharacterized protein LOC111708864 n=1 Tax=Eurytemora carolleeae TaxID=1294199 RepID=UPI000C766317|nr:uncharacterized protein LOC111708864 [Eurytemora carolleeae]|eukprot:XP_023338135.1 uncharacterized protein LOC111708864 [Eurytemora affinis]
MSYSGFVWTPSCSLTAMKYQRYGYVDAKPFVPGERLSASRELDRNVKGYKELRKELFQVRRDVDRQRETSVLNDRAIKTSYYKSPVGTRSFKGSGSVFYSDPIGRPSFFSSAKKY